MFRMKKCLYTYPLICTLRKSRVVKSGFSRYFLYIIAILLTKTDVQDEKMFICISFNLYFKKVKSCKVRLFEVFSVYYCNIFNMNWFVICTLRKARVVKSGFSRYFLRASLPQKFSIIHKSLSSFPIVQ